QLFDAIGEDPFLAAVRAAETADKMDPETLERLAALGYVHTTSGESGPADELPDPKDMIEHWEKVQEGVHEQARGNVKRSVEVLEECLAKVPRDMWARTIVINAYRQLGDLDKAMSHLEVVEQQAPDDLKTFLTKASLHGARREFHQAGEWLARAEAAEPGSAQVLMQRGALALLQGRVEEAVAAYRQALELDPGTSGPPALHQIGMVHLRNGKLDEARESFQHALEIDALNGQAHDGLAQILIAEDKNDEAMKELLTALRFNPNQPGALSTLAGLISEQGDQERAKKIAERAVDISPKLPQALNNLGLIHRRTGNLEKAEEYYKLAIESGPRLASAYVNLAQLYVRQGKSEEALKQFRLAVRANPRYPNPIALANIGVYHFNRREFKAALAFYRQALKVKPDYAMVHRYIASIFMLKPWGRPDRSLHHLRRSLELDPNQREAPQMRLIIGQLEKGEIQPFDAPPPLEGAAGGE
ncbi:MAG: tetratricopeptide repeat protein, partial [bacterium]|nr:tetratricopeptide repeat protein [bacterium]